MIARENTIDSVSIKRADELLFTCSLCGNVASTRRGAILNSRIQWGNTQGNWVLRNCHHMVPTVEALLKLSL